MKNKDYIGYLKYRLIRSKNILKNTVKTYQATNKEVYIAICVNEGFISQASVLIKSMINIRSRIKLYILNISLNNQHINLLRQICPINVTIEEIRIDAKELVNLPISNKWPIEAWARILIPKYIQCNRVLYLDSDCVIVDDIRELFTCDLNDYWIAGVQSPFAKERSEAIGCDRKGINSGVCLMNLDKLREGNFIEKVIEYGTNNFDKLVMPDQDSINYICRGRILSLDPKYNLMNIFLAYNHKAFADKINDLYYDKIKYNEAKNFPKIIHYNGGPFERPWNKGGVPHPYREIYKYYS